MRAHTGVRDVCGYSEIREPQVLYVRVAESLLYRIVKIFTGEHRSHRISQVHNLPPPLRHFLPANEYSIFTYEYFSMVRISKQLLSQEINNFIYFSMQKFEEKTSYNSANLRIILYKSIVMKESRVRRRESWDLFCLTLDHSLAFCVVVVMFFSMHHRAPMKAPMLTPPTISMGIPASMMAFSMPT